MERQTFNKTYKFRLYPTRTQERTLEKHLSLCRWLYNHFLEEKRTLYQENKTKTSCFDQIKEIPELKREMLELKEVYSQTLQDVAQRLDKAFQGFFRRVRENKQGKNQKVGYPRLRGYWRYDSFTYPQAGFQLKDNKLNLSKIGSLKIELHRLINGNIKTLTVRRTSTNKWYACFSVEVQKKLPKKQEIKDMVGLDVGLTNFLTTSQGEKIDNPRYLVKSEKKLAKIQREHSRKKLRSENRAKSRLKVARIYEKTTDQRLDFLHKLSRRLVNFFQLIAFEKLNIKGMVRNKYLSRSISDVAWAGFLQLLRYKAEEAGIWAVEVNPENTSQVCSGCGNVVEKTLAERKHKCPDCGLAIDRDMNAAKNILRLALNTVGTTGINACGVGRMLLTRKQEVIGFNRW